MLNREDLINEYVERMVDGMDFTTLAVIAFEKLRDDLRTYTDEQLRTEIMDYYPDLLENEND